MIGNLDDWTFGPFDYKLIHMDDYLADSCTISPTAFLFLIYKAYISINLMVSLSDCDREIFL